MKAILSLFDKPSGILLVLLVLGFYGCGKAPDTTADSHQEEEHEHGEGEDHDDGHDDHEHEEGEDHDDGHDDHEHEEGEDHDEGHDDHEHEEGEDHDEDHDDHEHEEGEDQDHEHDEEEHAHHHEAPHGGTSVAIGDHFAHLEIVLDSETGKLIAYVLDGELENPIRLTQESMEFSLALKKAGGGTSVTMIELAAVANALTGETVGDSSEFSVESEKLKGVEEFSAVVSTLEIKGETINDVEFDFPEGNE